MLMLETVMLSIPDPSDLPAFLGPVFKFILFGLPAALLPALGRVWLLPAGEVWFPAFEGCLTDFDLGRVWFPPVVGLDGTLDLLRTGVEDADFEPGFWLVGPFGFADLVFPWVLLA